MAIDLRTEQIPASGILLLQRANTFFLLQSTAGTHNFRTKPWSGGNAENLVGVGAGLNLQRVKAWSASQLEAAAGTVVSFLYGEAQYREDSTDFQAVIASISGNVTTLIKPSTTIIASGADTSIATATALSVAANLSRRRITVGSLSTNTGSVRIQTTGAGANKGLELQPGTFVELDTTSAFDVRNDSGANQSVYLFEET